MEDERSYDAYCTCSAFHSDKSLRKIDSHGDVDRFVILACLWKEGREGSREDKIPPISIKAIYFEVKQANHFLSLPLQEMLQITDGED